MTEFLLRFKDTFLYGFVPFSGIIFSVVLSIAPFFWCCHLSIDTKGFRSPWRGLTCYILSIIWFIVMISVAATIVSYY